MALKKHKPTTSTLRFKATSSFEELTPKRKALRKLLKAKRRGSGRNLKGRITVRHRGGGHKRLYRMIDFKRDKHNIPAKVISIEYDPNRSAHIALLHYRDREMRYIIAPMGLKVGDELISGPQAEPKVGNAPPLHIIPLGSSIHNIELRRGEGGKLVRGAGLSAQLLTKGEGFGQVKLPSGEVRLIPLDCQATIGQVGNLDHRSISSGKAGRSRWLGIRPTVRGVAMNPVDHPLGGGEGKSSGGRHPVSPWGKPAKGGKTRRRKVGRYLLKRRR